MRVHKEKQDHEDCHADPHLRLEECFDSRDLRIRSEAKQVVNLRVNEHQVQKEHPCHHESVDEGIEEVGEPEVLG